MEIVINEAVCSGYGNCVTAAPEFFDLNDSGQAVALRTTVLVPEDVARARAAMDICPMGAISLTE
jgi:ferredoxin